MCYIYLTYFNIHACTVVEYHIRVLELTNLTSAGETSSLESMTAGGWLLAGSLATGLDTPLRDATCDLEKGGAGIGTERGHNSLYVVL